MDVAFKSFLRIIRSLALLIVFLLSADQIFHRSDLCKPAAFLVAVPCRIYISVKYIARGEDP